MHMAKGGTRSSHISVPGGQLHDYGHGFENCGQLPAFVHAPVALGALHIGEGEVTCSEPFAFGRLHVAKVLSTPLLASSYTRSSVF